MRKWMVGLMMAMAVSAFGVEEGADEKRLIGDHAREFGPLNFIQGEPFTLEEIRKRRVTLVEFWATWCAPCKDSAAHLTKLYEKYQKNGLVVIGITEETPEEANPFVKEMGDKMIYPVATLGEETQKKYFEDFELTGQPWAFLIDRHGRIVWYGHPMNPFIQYILPVLLADIPEEFWPITEKLSHKKEDEKKE
jgi:thiol-disulfide isomerase/thioredoxin